MVAQRAGSEEVTNGRGDNTLINWNPSLEDKFVTKTRDQPEPGSFFSRSLWGEEMKDPGNEVGTYLHSYAPTFTYTHFPSLICTYLHLHALIFTHMNLSLLIYTHLPSLIWFYRHL